MTEREVRRSSPDPGAWDAAYRSGIVPWDVGHPQSVFVRLADAGAIASPVLEAGCGTGGHALYFSSRGIEAVGVDFSPVAIAAARAKAAERRLPAEFFVHDVLDLASLGQQFQTLVDSGTFHVFNVASDVARYVEGLRTVLAPAGVLHLLCFSDAQPGDVGPRRVSQADLRAAFDHGWSIESIEPATFDVNPPIGAAKAWLARIVRLEDPPRT
ncbi:MAG: class I SAM-dependent methyltransferase [Chloroflexota bacterium]